MDRRKFLSFLAAVPALPTLGTVAAQAETEFYVYGDIHVPFENTDWYESMMSNNTTLAEMVIRNITEKNLLYGYFEEKGFDGLARCHHEPA